MKTMPKKKTATKTPKLAIENAPIGETGTAELEYKDRLHLAKLFNDPVFVTAWKNAHAMRPSLFTDNLNSELGSVIATNRLHELRGWSMFEAALLKQARDPVRLRSVLRENYPDSAVPGGPVN